MANQSIIQEDPIEEDVPLLAKLAAGQFINLRAVYSKIPILLTWSVRLINRGIKGQSLGEVLTLLS